MITHRKLGQGILELLCDNCGNVYTKLSRPSVLKARKHYCSEECAIQGNIENLLTDEERIAHTTIRQVMVPARPRHLRERRIERVSKLLPYTDKEVLKFLSTGRLIKFAKEIWGSEPHRRLGTYDFENWQFHMMNLVMSEKPDKYLEKHSLRKEQDEEDGHTQT